MDRNWKLLPPTEAGGPCPISLYRLGLVHLVLARLQRGETMAKAANRVASVPHPDHRGVVRYVSERTLRRWWSDYLQEGVDALRPTEREKASGPVILEKKLADFLAEEKRNDPRASVPELIRRARVDGLIRPGQRICRSTVYRTLKRMGVPLARRRRAADRDSRAFEYPHRLDMVLCDGKHFRAGASRVKRVALNFFDDATRKHLDSLVGPSESTVLFLRGLKRLIDEYGMPLSIYVDKGPGFISLDTREVIRRLGISLIVGETAYPQGHAKVERYNQTQGEEVLREFSGNPLIDPTCEALELRIEHFRTRVYNPRGHEGLKGESPAARFDRDEKPLCFVPPSWLEERFALFHKRRVSAHHLVKYGGEEYEVPRGLAGSWVLIERRVLDDNRLLLHHEGRLVELHRVDKVANAHARRGRPKTPEQPKKRSPIRTAAGRAFARDHACVLDDNGGFPEPKALTRKANGRSPRVSKKNHQHHGNDDTGNAGEEA